MGSSKQEVLKLIYSKANISQFRGTKIIFNIFYDYIVIFMYYNVAPKIVLVH